MMHMSDYGTFDAGPLKLSSGETLSDAFLVYKTYGTLNEDRSNVILYPTSFSARHHDTEWLIRAGGALDPDRYFIVIPNLYGNGLSASPSHLAPRTAWPNVTYYDAISVQRRLLIEKLGIDSLALVYGWSMGGMQAFHWAARYPSIVKRIAVVCGSAKCSPWNMVFLAGIRASLEANPSYKGTFRAKPSSDLKALARYFAGWAMSPGFYRDELWRQSGYDSLQAYLEQSWDHVFDHCNGNDLLAQLWTWQHGDISQCEEFGGDLQTAMAAIRSDVLLMPGYTDQYFRVSAAEAEMKLLLNARSVRFRPIMSEHGHRAGNPINVDADRAFLEETVTDFLRETA